MYVCLCIKVGLGIFSGMSSCLIFEVLFRLEGTGKVGIPSNFVGISWPMTAYNWSGLYPQRYSCAHCVLLSQFCKKKNLLLLFSSLFMSDSETPWTVACQASLSFTISQSLPKFMSIGRWCYPNISSFTALFSCLQSFPALGSFPMSLLLTSGIKSIRASAKVLPMSIQGWSPLGLTGMIYLLSKGLLRVFSSTTIWKHQFFGTQPSLWFNSYICT